MIESETFKANSLGVSVDKKKDFDKSSCGRGDSGMEESNSHTSIEADASDDEDEVLVRKSKKRSNRVLDDDSEESQDVPEPSDKKAENRSLKTAEDVLDAVLNDSDDECDTTTTPAPKRKHIKRPAGDDSSSDEDEKKTLLSSLKKDSKMSDIFDAEESDEEKETLQKTTANEENLSIEPSENDEGRPEIKKSVFSDADDSDSGGSSTSQSRSSGSEAGSDEGFDESAISPTLLAKLKKGASKKTPNERKKRACKPDVTEIHSETQRMVRESRVSLPYHQPAPKSINDFLARASKKQQEYRVLRGARDMTKAKVLQEVLVKARIQAKPKSQEDADKFSDSDTEWTPENDKEQDQKEKVDQWLERVRSQDSDKDSEDEEHTAKEHTAKEHTAKEHTAKEHTAKEHTAKEVLDSQQDKQVNTMVEEKDLPDLAVNCDVKNTQDRKTDTEQVCVLESEGRDKDVNPPTDMDVSQCESGTKIQTGNAPCGETVPGDLDVNNDKSNSNKNMETSADLENIDPSRCDDSDDKLTLGGVKCTDVSDPQKPAGESTESVVKQKRQKLAALVNSQLGNVTPKLNSGVDTFICLDEGESTPRNPGLAKLIDRLCKHSAKSEKKRHKDTAISVIQKDTTTDNKEELTLNTFTYHETEKTENPLMKLEIPGAKLVALKEQLKEKMKVRREVARQKRQALYDLDNEEGGYEEEEEEAEMTDHTDTDVEDNEEEDDFEEQYGGEEEEEEKERNPFADDEADEDGDDEVQEAFDDGEDEMNLKLDISDDENSEASEKSSSMTKSSFTARDESKDDFKEPADKPLEKPFSMFGSRTRERESSVSSDTQLQSGQRSFRLTMPIEDSQDLCGTVPQLAPTQPEDSQVGSSFNFFLEDSQSQMLDAEGYLKVKTTTKKQPSVPMLDGTPNTQDNMDMLLGLCSGRFAGTQAEDKEKTSRKSLFDSSMVPVGTQGNMEDFMGLCSGVFTDSKNESTSERPGSRKRRLSASDDEDSNQSFECLSNVDGGADTDKENLSDNDAESKDDFINDDVEKEEEEEEEESGDEVDSDMEPKEGPVFKGFNTKNKHGKIRQEFLEDEAELSGSDAESDEDLDIPEEEDIMMVEEGDKDTANMDEDELRDQVGRAHFKHMIDDDKRQLMRFQEMYLPDGDLHSEGAGRTRKFRWNNMDDDTQQDMFDDDVDRENVAEEENENEAKWRAERFEREKWLKEQQEKENEEADNSQFLQLGKKILMKKKGSVECPRTAVSGTKQDPGTPNSFYKLAKQKRGSFLARSKQDLKKIAGMTKPLSNPSAGAKVSGKFVFQIISPDKTTEEASVKTKQRKAHVSKQKQPPAKKPKLESQSSFTQSSIFNHL